MLHVINNFNFSFKMNRRSAEPGAFQDLRGERRVEGVGSLWSTQQIFVYMNFVTCETRGGRWEEDKRSGRGLLQVPVSVEHDQGTAADDEKEFVGRRQKNKPRGAATRRSDAGKERGEGRGGMREFLVNTSNLT